MPNDHPAELQNRVLAEWNDHYLDIMEEAHIENAAKMSLAQAKRNAAYWVLDQGIGGVDAEFGADRETHPLAIFSGQSLLDVLMGPTTQASSRKRTRSATAEDDEDDAEAKRVRSSPHGQDDVAADGGALQDIADDDPGTTFDDGEIEPQIGRHEQPPMSDHHDSMPWNTYASSRHGSRPGSVRPPMSVAALSSSVGGRAGLDFMPSSIGSKRVSRVVAESPLEQRRRLLRHSSVLSGNRQAQDDTGHGSPDDDFGFDLDVGDNTLDRQLAGNHENSDDFELYGPAAAVSTQQAADSHWLAATLEQEAFNFLGFLQTAIEEKRVDMEDDEITREVRVTLEELLPSEHSNEVVAAQGFLHVLSLATKGLITVRQEEDFGAIDIAVVPKLSTADEEVEEA